MKKTFLSLFITLQFTEFSCHGQNQHAEKNNKLINNVTWKGKSLICKSKNSYYTYTTLPR